MTCDFTKISSGRRIKIGLYTFEKICLKCSWFSKIVIGENIDMVRSTKNPDFVPYAEDDPVWSAPLDWHDCLMVIAAVVDRARKDEQGCKPDMDTEETMTHKYYMTSEHGLKLDLEYLSTWGYNREWFNKPIKDDKPKVSAKEECLFGDGLND
jgi:hypothetical protein